MSTDFRPLTNIRACQLFDGRLEEFDVYEHAKPDMTAITRRCLTDGCNYLWAHIGDDGFLTSFTRYAPNGDPSKILNAVGEVFDTYIASEHEPQYWGFETQAEWEVSWTKESKRLSREFRKAERKFEIELSKCLREQPNGIEPGTVEETKAKIAKNLVEDDPTLLLEVNRARLRSEIKSIYDREVREVPF
jgi:hypothetical protein